MSARGAGRPSRLLRLRQRIDVVVEPRATGLPNWRVMAAFPALATLVTAVLVTLRISGTSSGAYWSTFGTGADPALLLGTPRTIRSDEWLVTQGWTVSQVREGFPVDNTTFPGGMDTTVLMELPNHDWSSIFRPHSWGYLLFGLEPGLAWFWWVPALGMAVAAYLLVVTLVPRRPLTAALLAGATFFTPIVQWWFGPNLQWPIAWSLLVMCAIRWMLLDRRRWTAWVWGVVVAWLSVTTAIGLYIPFIVPCAVVAIAFLIGQVAEARSIGATPVRRLAGALLPLAAAAVAAVAGLAAWVLTRTDTIAAINGTVYPGDRGVPSGQLAVVDPRFIGTVSGVFDQSLDDSSLNTVMGLNASEAATAPLFAGFVAIGLIVMVVRARRGGGRIDWLSIAVLASLAVVGLYLVIPRLEVLGHVLLFDRVPAMRFRVMLVVLIPLLFALIVRHVDRMPRRRVDWPALVAVALVAGTTAWGLRAILRDDPELLQGVVLWPIVALTMAAAVYLVFVRGAGPVAAGLLLASGLAVSGGVNPVYVGAFDLAETRVGQAVQEVEDRDPGVWIGLGGYQVMALVMESGVDGYSGVQTYPSREMWADVDPDGDDDQVWNRLAHIRWQFGTGEPVPRLFKQDVILTDFDPCSDFAAEHVRYVLSDLEAPANSCLTELDEVREGSSTFWIYEVAA